MMIGRAFLMNPIGLAITVIIGVLYLLWRNWDTVKAAIAAGWAWLSAKFGDNIIIKTINGLINHFKTFGLSWESLKHAAAIVWDAIVKTITGKIDAIIDKIKAAKNAVAGFFGFGSGPAPAVPLIGNGKGYSTGGYTGAGGVHEAAGIVHKGEVVFSQRDIARFGGWRVVEMLRRGGVQALNKARHLGRLLEAPSAPGGAPVLAGAITVPASFHRSTSYSMSGGSQNITIHIQGGSQSPQEIAREVARQLKAAGEAAARRARSAFSDKD